VVVDQALLLHEGTALCFKWYVSFSIKKLPFVGIVGDSGLWQVVIRGCAADSFAEFRAAVLLV